MQRTEHDRVCFGRSGIHGWGLFARRDIQEGEMVWNLNIELHVLLKSYYVVKFMYILEKLFRNVEACVWFRFLNTVVNR